MGELHIASVRNVYIGIFCYSTKYLSKHHCVECPLFASSTMAAHRGDARCRVIIFRFPILEPNAIRIYDTISYCYHMGRIHHHITYPGLKAY